MRVVVLMTCFNRKEHTKQCIESLIDKRNNVEFSFVVVDDNSNDGTVEMLKELSNQYDVHIVNGTGGLYYSGGMRLGMQYIKQNLTIEYDYFLMVNDDVDFYDSCIKPLLQQSRDKSNAVIVGATCSQNGNLSYGAIKYINRGIKYRTLSIFESDIQCDTFNANCVLIPKECFMSNDIIDLHYRHSLGDFDYGLALKRNGCSLYSSDFYVGVCNNNNFQNTWGDPNLSIVKRIIMKESVKGAPFKPWFYFLKKNFGILKAVIYSLTPYIRILMKK